MWNMNWLQVIWENEESLAVGVPHLIYISREKRPKHQHHFKAGAMNVLVINYLIYYKSKIIITSMYKHDQVIIFGTDESVRSDNKCTIYVKRGLWLLRK